MGGPWNDLMEHTGTLVAIISFVTGLFVLLFVALSRVLFRVALTLKQDLFNRLDKIDGRLDRVEEKQEKLREDLPRDYLRIEGLGYKTLVDGINRIEQHFETFAQDCRDGKCGGRLGRIKEI